MKKIAVSVLLSISLAGCGGGGSSSDSGSIPSTPPPAPQLTLSDVAGIFDGTVAQQDGTTFDVAGIVAPSGEIRFLTLDGEQLSGEMSISGDGLVISPFLSFFSADGYNGTSIVSELLESGSAEATFENNVISGESNFGGFTSEFTLTKNLSDTNQTASLSILSGNYVTENFDTSISIDGGGVISGSDIYGCLYSGNVSVPAANLNIYELQVSIDNCEIPNNDFSGLGVYFAASSSDFLDTFVFQADNGQLAITTQLTRD